MKISIFKSLYFQVLTAITLGVLLGHFFPELGAQMKPFGDGFVKLIKMIRIVNKNSRNTYIKNLLENFIHLLDFSLQTNL